MTDTAAPTGETVTPEVNPELNPEPAPEAATVTEVAGEAAAPAPDAAPAPGLGADAPADPVVISDFPEDEIHRNQNGKIVAIEPRMATIGGKRINLPNAKAFIQQIDLPAFETIGLLIGAAARRSKIALASVPTIEPPIPERLSFRIRDLLEALEKSSKADAEEALAIQELQSAVLWRRRGK